MEICNANIQRVWEDELNIFGWKMVFGAQMNSLLNSLDK